MGMFLALTALAIAISGALAFGLFWPMALVHLRDRHPQTLEGLGAFAFLSPHALCWLLRARYRNLKDQALDGLATPAAIALWCTLLALLASGLLWLIYR